MVISTASIIVEFSTFFRATWMYIKSKSIIVLGQNEWLFLLHAYGAGQKLEIALGEKHCFQLSFPKSSFQMTE